MARTRQDRTAGIGQQRKDNRGTTAIVVLLGQGRSFWKDQPDISAWTDQPGQDG
jgi:hypothetical protein